MPLPTTLFLILATLAAVPSRGLTFSDGSLAVTAVMGDARCRVGAVRSTSPALDSRPDPGPRDPWGYGETADEETEEDDRDDGGWGYLASSGAICADVLIDRFLSSLLMPRPLSLGRCRNSRSPP